MKWWYKFLKTILRALSNILFKKIIHKLKNVSKLFRLWQIVHSIQLVLLTWIKLKNDDGIDMI